MRETCRHVRACAYMHKAMHSPDPTFPILHYIIIIIIIEFYTTCISLSYVSHPHAYILQQYIYMQYSPV